MHQLPFRYDYTLVLIAIYSYGGTALPVWLRCGLSRSTIYRRCKELTEWGYLEKITTGKRTKGESFFYRITAMGHGIINEKLFS